MMRENRIGEDFLHFNVAKAGASPCLPSFRALHEQL